MFVDKAKIIIKSGNGGDGCTSFYTEKYVPDGGPDGGDGGKGGDIIFAADASMNTLINFKYTRKFKAEDGNRGDRKNMTGKSGKNTVIKVPAGTVIRDFETGSILADMFYPDTCKTIVRGGQGGKGNARFATSRRRAPHFHQTGEKTDEHSIILELKTIADIGLVGFPNVGKSTLLSVLTAARPKIDNYHFTTLSPNLGVVKMYDSDFVIADIPGLIEGASEGIGLGHEFLRHIERTRALVHIVDISGSEGRDPAEDYRIIRGELAGYAEKMSQAFAGRLRVDELPEIVVANKCDLLTDKSAIKAFEKKTKTKVIQISAAAREGLDTLLSAIYNTVKDLPRPGPVSEDDFSYAAEYDMSFEIVKESEDVYVVDGGLVYFLIRNVVLDDPDSFSYFQKMLNDKGVIKELRKAGAKSGDTVVVGDVEFDFVE